MFVSEAFRGLQDAARSFRGKYEEPIKNPSRYSAIVELCLQFVGLKKAGVDAPRRTF